MRPLDRKLLRDLWRLRSQVLTIALVVASGIGGFIGSLSAHTSLVTMRDAYYEAGRFAHVFATAKRVPRRLERELAAIPGVSAVQTTVAGSVVLSLPEVVESMTGLVIALPEAGRPQINRVFLQQGRWPGEADLRGVIVSEAFAKARGLAPGDRITALMNGRYETLHIRGIALSPEFIFAAAQGGFSDDTRFGVLWVGRELLEGAYDMRGAFNQAALRLMRGASEARVVATVDRVLAPYGSTGAFGRGEQLSHRTLTSEIDQQRVFGTVLPAVFLAVAIFLLNVLLSRHIATERSQIAALKALGYSDLAIGLHYLKLVLVIALLGSALGVLIGAAFGRWMTGLYTGYFHFPAPDYRMTAWLPLLGGAVVLAGAVMAAARSVRSVVRLPPAEAMRPPSPASFRATLLERLGWGRLLSPAARSVVREIERRPARAGLTVFGLASAVAIVVAGTWWGDGFEHLIELEFAQRERPDVMIILTEPVAREALHELARLPGVLEVEGARALPVRFSNGPYSVRTSLRGLEPGARLRQMLDARGRPVPLVAGGVALPEAIARRLGVRLGERLWVEPLTGERPEQLLPVTALVGDLLGSDGYTDRRTANRLAGEGNTLDAVRLRLDRQHQDAFLEAVRSIPRIAAVGDKALMLEHFRQTGERNLLVFTGILSVFAACIAVGVVYNGARIALAERAWELATLRVIGFTRQEVSRILLGQMFVQILLAIPVGALLGWLLAALLATLIASEELRLPLAILPATYARATLVMLAAGAVSALIVRRRIDRLDLVGVLKTRE